MSGVCLGGDAAFCFCELLCDGAAAVSGEIAGATRAAKAAAPCAQRAIAVGAGKAAVERQTVDLFAKVLFEIAVQTVVGLAQPVRMLCVRGYVRLHISIFLKISYPV